jgi:hypothetical protein
MNVLLIIVQLFEPLTKKFSAGDAPLIADVLEDLHKLRNKLVRVRDTTHIPVEGGSPRRNPDVIRVGAHAAILVHDKYIPKLHKCEIYAISIGEPSIFIDDNHSIFAFVSHVPW